MELLKKHADFKELTKIPDRLEKKPARKRAGTDR
jgi:hypothetical protein